MKLYRRIFGMISRAQFLTRLEVRQEQLGLVLLHLPVLYRESTQRVIQLY
jgi:hypothetical protein